MGKASRKNKKKKGLSFTSPIKEVEVSIQYELSMLNLKKRQGQK